MEKTAGRTLKNLNKKIFLIASNDAAKCDLISSYIKSKFEDAIIYTATEQVECVQKIINARPLVLITDFALAESQSVQTIERLLESPEYDQLPIILAGGPTQKSDHVDDVVTGKIQFIDKLEDSGEFYAILNRALNFSNALNPSNYKMKYLNVGDVLINEGEIAGEVYILKKGSLLATRKHEGETVVLGQIQPGEFVGEMGFLNKSERVATVTAIEESQVVSIPNEIFDNVIFKRPAWSKIILATLSKRLSTALKR